MSQFLKNRVVQVALAVVAVVIVVVALVVVLSPDDKGTVAVTEATPAVTASAEPTPAAQSAEPPTTPSEPAPTPAGETCTNFTGPMESPTKFVVERMGVESPMMVVGNDSNGNPGAPPPNAPYTTAWYNGSPAAGTDKGNVILTIHTYSKGQALGNDLYGAKGLNEPTPGAGLQEGDVIKISDAEGRQVCYRYSNNTKIWVKTYDPNSNVFHNPDGPPQLAIMVCWDYKGPDAWDSRILFYAPLIPEGTPA